MINKFETPYENIEFYFTTKTIDEASINGQHLSNGFGYEWVLVNLTVIDNETHLQWKTKFFIPVNDELSNSDKKMEIYEFITSYFTFPESITCNDSIKEIRKQVVDLKKEIFDNYAE